MKSFLPEDVAKDEDHSIVAITCLSDEEIKVKN